MCDRVNFCALFCIFSTGYYFMILLKSLLFKEKNGAEFYKNKSFVQEFTTNVILVF
jgi:hypothetical protein